MISPSLPSLIPLAKHPFTIVFATMTLAVLTSSCTHCPRTSSSRSSNVYIAQLAPYSRVTTSDFEGRCIAEYIAEGPVEETRGGFTFRAVERRIYQPMPLTFRYPLGRPVVAIASNIIVDPTPRPEWLVSNDHR